MPRPEKIEESELPEEGETPYYFHLPQRCTNRGENAMHDAWTTWLASDEAVEIVARKIWVGYMGVSDGWWKDWDVLVLSQKRAYYMLARGILSALAGEGK